MKRHALLISTLLLLCTVFTSVASYMKDNPFNLSTELTLTNNYNPQILAFWKQHANSHYFQGVDDKTIHSISIISGNDKAIVISQGRNESVLKYKEVAYDLHQQGYDIFLIDHRGQGFSERFGGDQHRGYVEEFQDYVIDLNSYINSLQLDEKYTQRYLLSHSMGGAISALYLQQYKHPFQGSVFFSPMLSINFGILPSFLAKMISYSSAEVCSWFSDKACYVPAGKGYIDKKFKRNYITQSEKRFYSSQIGFKEFPETQLGDATMRWVATSISATEQAIENAGNINIPILVMQAGNDGVVTAVGPRSFFENLAQCDLNEFVTIAGAKHEILLERDELRLTALTRTLQFFKATTQGKQVCIK